MWEGASCGRGEKECVTCYQGGEVIPDCTKQSVLYENVCAVCIPKASRKEQIREQDLDVGRPALYVGESSRSIAERGKEHWASYRGSKEDSHVLKHQVMEHGAAPAKFILRVVGSYQTALARQVSGENTEERGAS